MATIPSLFWTPLSRSHLSGPGAHLKTEDAHAGVLQIDPGTDYAAHTHAWPEAYYIIQGTADCDLG